jgi:hypothetical protein
LFRDSTWMLKTTTKDFFSARSGEWIGSDGWIERKSMWNLTLKLDFLIMDCRGQTSFKAPRNHRTFLSDYPEIKTSNSSSRPSTNLSWKDAKRAQATFFLPSDVSSFNRIVAEIAF